MIEFLNKQIWRVTQTLRIIQPMLLLIDLLLVGVIAVGINEWFQLTVVNFIVITTGFFIAFNLVGYVLDKTGFFLEHKIREFKIAYPEMWGSQVLLASALTALFLKDWDKEMIIELIKRESGRLDVDLLGRLQS